MNLNKQEIIEEIRKGSDIGKEIFKIELDYYRDLVKINEDSPSHRKKNDDN